MGRTRGLQLVSGTWGMWAHSQSVTAVAGVVEQMAKNLKLGEDEGL